MAGLLYVDLTIVSACSQEAIGCGSAVAAGTAARLAEQHKCAKYPNIETWPFAVEDHGRWGDSAVALARTLAPTAASLRSFSLSRLYQSVGCALQCLAADAMVAAIP